MALLKQRWLIALILLLVGGLGGAGLTFAAVQQGWFEASSVEEEPEQPVVKPHFHPLNKLVVGLASARGQRFMVLDLALVGRAPDFESQSTTLEPLVQNAVLRYFSRHDYAAALEESRDVEALQQQLLEHIRATVAANDHELAIDNVLLTKVVIQ